MGCGGTCGVVGCRLGSVSWSLGTDGWWVFTREPILSGRLGSSSSVELFSGSFRAEVLVSLSSVRVMRLSSGTARTDAACSAKRSVFTCMIAKYFSVSG